MGWTLELVMAGNQQYRFWKNLAGQTALRIGGK
jgi:hypothetical protein